GGERRAQGAVERGQIRRAVELPAVPRRVHVDRPQEEPPRAAEDRRRAGEELGLEGAAGAVERVPRGARRKALEPGVEPLGGAEAVVRGHVTSPRSTTRGW